MYRVIRDIYVTLNGLFISSPRASTKARVENDLSPPDRLPASDDSLLSL